MVTANTTMGTPRPIPTPTPTATEGTELSHNTVVLEVHVHLCSSLHAWDEHVHELIYRSNCIDVLKEGFAYKSIE